MTNVTRVIVRESNYWSSGATLTEARKNFKKYNGNFPSSKANIVSLTGEKEAVEQSFVNELGDISYPKSVTLTRIN